MKLTLAEIINITGGELVGDKDFVVTSLCSMENVKSDGLCYVSDPRKKEYVEKAAGAGCVLFPAAAKGQLDFKGNAIYSDNPEWAFVKVLRYYDSLTPKFDTGVHPTAVIGKNVKLGANVTIGAYTVIEDDVTIGDNAVLYPHVYIGRRTQIGSDGIIYPNVTVREECIIKNRVIIEAGAVIGGDGFGFIFVNGKHEKVPQIGNVILEDDVEVGANTTVDRAKIDSTVIGRCVKIDNLVQIGHNVKIGDLSLIISQVGIAGSTELGMGCILAGQVGVSGHLKLADGFKAGPQAGIMGSHLKPGEAVFGTPEREYHETMKIYAIMGRLPDMYKQFKKLKKEDK
ncbi:UDP-3-O-[3-hydroxymyristoyl] glucosamine N-acyltransferase [Elusimicrobium posterum]|uniref:UDP-3-O-(3-hydroxymyristoyl)glucosamine N-acyltransferase n=1 Tax=Elusimicrobium posterum TaxID=3116653 RepID=UPI003C7376BD